MPADLDAQRRGVLTMLMARIEAINASIGHNLTHGEENEDAIRQLLKDILPPNLGVGSGVIVGMDGQTSKQTDIVVFDRTRMNFTLREDSRLFFADQVVLAMEIKTRFDRENLRNALESVSSVKRLRVYPEPWHESFVDPETGDLIRVRHEPSPPLAMAFFLRSRDLDRPVDLKSHLEMVKTEVEQFPLLEQPEIVFSLAHASCFHHPDLAAHSSPAKNFVFLVGDGVATHFVLRPENGPVDSVVDFTGILDSSAGHLIWNRDRNAISLLLLGENTYRPVAYRTGIFDGVRFLLDQPRSFLVFMDLIDQALRWKRLNRRWSASHYFGSGFMDGFAPEHLENQSRRIREENI